MTKENPLKKCAHTVGFCNKCDKENPQPCEHCVTDTVAKIKKDDIFRLGFVEGSEGMKIQMVKRINEAKSQLLDDFQEQLDFFGITVLDEYMKSQREKLK